MTTRRRLPGAASGPSSAPGFPAGAPTPSRRRPVPSGSRFPTLTNHVLRTPFATEASFSLHHELPRQAPAPTRPPGGCSPSAARCRVRPRVLDLGCGPGRGALLLAAEAGARVTAVDLHRSVLDELRAAAEARGVADRIRPVNADMSTLACAAHRQNTSTRLGRGHVRASASTRRATRSKRLLAPGGPWCSIECVWTTEAYVHRARAFSDHIYPLLSAPADLRGRRRHRYRGARRSCTSPTPTAPSTTSRSPSMSLLADSVGSRHRGGAGRDARGARRTAPARAEYGYTAYVLRPTDRRGPPDRRRRPTGGGVRRQRRRVRDPDARPGSSTRSARTPRPGCPELSYVAEAPDGTIAAYALITRCHVDEVPALALAPVAVLPDRQRQGAGAAVVRAALEAARARGERLVLVLGHPEYYPRFGFVRAPSTASGRVSTCRTRR